MEVKTISKENKNSVIHYGSLEDIKDIPESFIVLSQKRYEELLEYEMKYKTLMEMKDENK